MDQAQLTNVLAACRSIDQTIRTQAEQHLTDFKAHNFPAYAHSLAICLANNEAPTDLRSTAGLILKLSLTAKDETEKRNVHQRWLAVDANVRSTVKAAVLATLASPSPEARGVSAQLVSYIAAIELPVNVWPELITALLQNVHQPNDGLKQATLEAFGYMCEETDEQVLTQQSNQILNAVCKGIQDPNQEVVLTACRAMCNALEFVKTNFEKEEERNHIMGVLFESAASQNPKIRQTSMECFVKVASLYYDKLGAHMNKLFTITLEAIKKDGEEIAKQALEFWSTICDEETDIAFEIAEYGSSTRESRKFVQAALAHLVPLLTECLTKQEDDPEEDEWNVATAAGTCLSLVTNTVEDAVVPLVMPFIEQNIQSTNWKLKEAATLAFGAILEGPKNLSAMIANAMPLLLEHMKDPVVYVKDTTAWTIGRVCQLFPEIVASGLNPVLTVLVASLDDSPRVASYGCWAINNLTASFIQSSSNQSSEISPFFGGLLQKLMMVTERPDSDESKLRASAYEAIDNLISCCPKDCHPIFVQAIPVFVERLSKTIDNKSSFSNEQRIEIQSLICGTLQAITRKLGAGVLPYADKLMELFLKIPTTHEKVTSAHEEALMSIGAITNAIEGDFEKYMPYVRAFLISGLRNSEEHTVCAVSVGLVGDIARGISGKISPYCDEIVTILLSALTNAALHRDVKPPILSAFGDIALAIGPEFQKYMPTVMNMLQQASHTTVNPNDYDLVDYLNQLREGIFEAYTGIILGLKSDQSTVDAFLPYVSGVLDFISFVWDDQNKSEAVIKGAIGVIGDIVSSLGSKVKTQCSQPSIKNIIAECCKMTNESDIRETALWVKELASKI